jgi:DNA-binding winged helix-turn-helix (wHTH) protein
VDVHIRRLCAKLGDEHQELIATVRNVGYKCIRLTRAGRQVPRQAAVAADSGPDRARVSLSGDTIT